MLRWPRPAGRAAAPPCGPAAELRGMAEGCGPSRWGPYHPSAITSMPQPDDVGVLLRVEGHGLYSEVARPSPPARASAELVKRRRPATHVALLPEVYRAFARQWTTNGKTVPRHGDVPPSGQRQTRNRRHPELDGEARLAPCPPVRDVDRTLADKPPVALGARVGSHRYPLLRGGARNRPHRAVGRKAKHPGGLGAGPQRQPTGTLLGEEPQM